MSQNDKLHALLAVEGDAKAQAEKFTGAVSDLFKSKVDNFVSKHSTFEVYEEGARPLDPEAKEMETTVDEVLESAQKSLIRAIDCTLQKEATNTEAKSDLVVGNKTLAKDVPATALLYLESRLKQIKLMYSEVPTLHPGREWNRDESDAFGVYRAAPEYRVRTEKVEFTEVVVPATKEHPAQTRDRVKDKQIGKRTTILRAGLWTKNHKEQVLERLNELIVATKKARQRANDTQVKKVFIGRDIFDYINEASSS